MWRGLVDAVRAHEVDDVVIDVDRLAGIAPEAGDDVVLHRASVDVGVVDVGDLELAASRRCQVLDDLEDARIIHVDADHRVRRRRALGLLTDVQDAAVLHDRHAQMAQVRGALHLLQQQPRPARLSLEILDVGGDGLFEDVVAEHDDELVVSDECCASPSASAMPPARSW